MSCRAELRDEGNKRSVQLRCQLIEHPIHGHAGHRNIKPQWQRDSRDPSMQRPSPAQCPTKRDQNQRQNDNCEDRVAAQNRQIDWLPFAFGKSRDADSMANSNCVIGHITGKKCCRRDQCAGHENCVRPPAATADTDISDRKQCSTDPIQTCVDPGEIMDAHPRPLLERARYLASSTSVFISAASLLS